MAGRESSVGIRLAEAGDLPVIYALTRRRARMIAATPVEMAETRNRRARMGEFHSGRAGIAPSMMPV